MGADDGMAIARTIAGLGAGGEDKKYLPQRHEVRKEAKQGYIFALSAKRNQFSYSVLFILLRVFVVNISFFVRFAHPSQEARTTLIGRSGSRGPAGRMDASPRRG